MEKCLLNRPAHFWDRAISKFCCLICDFSIPSSTRIWKKSISKMRGPIAKTILGVLHCINSFFCAKGALLKCATFPQHCVFLWKNHEKTMIFWTFFGWNFFEKNQKLKSKNFFFYFFPRYFREFLQRFLARVGPYITFNWHGLCDRKIKKELLILEAIENLKITIAKNVRIGYFSRLWK